MHGRTALIAVVLLLVMAAISAVLLRPAAAPSRELQAPAWLVDLVPSSVRRLEVAVPGRAAIVVEPSEIDGVWVMMQSGQDLAASPGWPVASSQVRGIIRLIADFAKAPATDARPPEGSTRVRLAMKDGPWREIFVGTSELAGRVPVAISNESGADGAQSGNGARDRDGDVQGLMVDAGLARLLRHEGMLAWRETLVFPSSVEPSTRISLMVTDAVGVSGPVMRLEASKVQGRWALTAPFAARAEPQAPAGVLLLAARAAPRSFIEPAPPDRDTGLDQPTLVLRLEQPVNMLVNDTVRRRVLTQTLERGWASGEGASFARVTATLKDLESREESVVWGPMVMSVGDEHFTGLSVDPSNWVARVATVMPPADVRRIEIVRGTTASALVRTVDGWRGEDGASAESFSGLDASALADALLAWLGRTPAASIEAGPQSVGTTTIRLFGPSAAEGAALPPAEEFTLESIGGVWRLSRDGVTRLYRGPVAGLEKAGLVIE
jgi:hypothetical protein